MLSHYISKICRDKTNTTRNHLGFRRFYAWNDDPSLFRTVEKVGISWHRAQVSVSVLGLKRLDQYIHRLEFLWIKSRFVHRSRRPRVCLKRDYNITARDSYVGPERSTHCNFSVSNQTFTSPFLWQHLTSHFTCVVQTEILGVIRAGLSQTRNECSNHRVFTSPLRSLSPCIFISINILQVYKTLYIHANANLVLGSFWTCQEAYNAFHKGSFQFFKQPAKL